MYLTACEYISLETDAVDSSLISEVVEDKVRKNALKATYYRNLRSLNPRSLSFKSYEWKKKKRKAMSAAEVIISWGAFLAKPKFSKLLNDICDFWLLRHS